LRRDVRGDSVVAVPPPDHCGLLVASELVFHILGPKAVAPASLTKVATPHPDGTLTYLARAAKASNMDGSMSRLLNRLSETPASMDET
jgi:hypothetical protein